jgi:MFS family permease
MTDNTGGSGGRTRGQRRWRRAAGHQPAAGRRGDRGHRGRAGAAALLANVVNGVVNVGMTIVAIWLLDRVGRRTLLITGTCGMAVGLTVIALVFAVGGSNLSGSAAIVAIIALFFYTGSFAIGLGPVFWLYFWRRVPETKGLRLEEISAQIEGERGGT